MKKIKCFLNKFIILSLVLFFSGCASLQERKQEFIDTVLSEDGSPISFAVEGVGEPTIVFVHCWTCDHKFWKHQIDYFTKRNRVVWLDLAGHGLSGSTRSEYTMEAFGQDVAAVVNKAGGDKVVLVGHSMGGPVCLEAAKILGDKAVAIVGVDTFYTPFPSPKSEAEIEDILKPFKEDFSGTTQRMVQSMFTPSVDPELKASIVKQLSNANSQMATSALYEIFRWSVQNNPNTLESYSSKLWNINAAPTGNEKPSNKSVTLIPGVGHFVPQVKPEEFNVVLSKIISRYS